MTDRHGARGTIRAVPQQGVQQWPWLVPVPRRQSQRPPVFLEAEGRSPVCVHTPLRRSASRCSADVALQAPTAPSMNCKVPAEARVPFSIRHRYKLGEKTHCSLAGCFSPLTAFITRVDSSRPFPQHTGCLPGCHYLSVSPLADRLTLLADRLTLRTRPALTLVLWPRSYTTSFLFDCLSRVYLSLKMTRVSMETTSYANIPS